MSKSWPAKDPLEVLDYGFNWLPRFLEEGETTTADTIATISSNVLEGSVVVDSDNTTPGSFVTTTWLSGGVVGETCLIDLTITTTEQRTFNQLMKIKIKDR